MKTKTITLIFIAFLLSGCTLLDRATGKTPANPASTPTQEAAVMVAQASATIDWSTPTPTLLPSPNSMDTQIAADRDNADREIEAANIKLNAAHLEQTNVSDSKTLEADRKTTAANIMAGTTTQLVIVGTNDEANRQFQKIVPTLIVAGTQAMYTGQKSASEIALNWGIAIFLVLIGLTLLIAMTTSRKVSPNAEPAQEADPSVDPPGWERKFAPVNSNGMGLHVSPPGNHAHFLAFALVVCSGRKGFSKPEWEGADSPYNRETYGVVYNFLWKHKFIELPPGEKIRWTQQGREWVDNWIERNLVPSPTEDEESISADLSTEISQDAENQGAESGGGVIVDVENDLEPETI